MRYLALDFETGNASPLSACALGASVFEDNQLVDEKISLIRPPECVGKFHWGNVRVNHIKEKMVADAPSFAEVWEPLADIAEGTVYALLVRLEQRGLVDVERVPSEKGPPRKVYTINAEGRTYLDEFWRTWSFLSDRLAQLREGER